MSYSYEGTATYHASITLPHGSDVHLIAGVTTPIEKLADRTASLKATNDAQQIELMSQGLQIDALQNIVLGSPRSGFTPLLPDPAAVYPGTHWVFEESSSSHVIKQTNVDADPDRLHVRIPRTALPAGAAPTGLNLRLRGYGTHEQLPATMPAMFLMRQTVPNGTGSQVGQAIDPSTTLAAYQAVHDVSLAINALDFDTYDYILRVRGESGSYAKTSLEITSAHLAWVVF